MVAPDVKHVPLPKSDPALNECEEGTRFRRPFALMASVVTTLAGCDHISSTIAAPITACDQVFGGGSKRKRLLKRQAVLTRERFLLVGAPHDALAVVTATALRLEGTLTVLE